MKLIKDPEKVYRFLMYGILCVFLEICYYSLVKILSMVPVLSGMLSFVWRIDPRLNLETIWDAPLVTLFGQSSLWMFLIYGIIALFIMEPLVKKMADKPWIIRGLVYMCVITCCDIVFGYLARLITGYDIWFNQGAAIPILKYSCVAVQPVWFIFGLMGEKFIVICKALSRTLVTLRLKNEILEQAEADESERYEGRRPEFIGVEE